MKHKALNYLFQSGGGIAMKVVLCFIDKKVQEEGLDVTFVGNIHDEVQAEVEKHDVIRYNKVVRWAFEATTNYLGLRCPLAGEVQSGDSWAETH